MRRWSKILILIMSILIYTYFVGMFTIYLALLSGVIIVSLRLGQGKKSLPLLVVPIVLLFLGFLMFRGYSTNYTMPLGYSIFAFSGIALLVDCYHSRKTYPVLDSLLYLWFFPKMLAGPIIRIEDFSNQLDKVPHIDAVTIYAAFKIIVFSAFCKFIVADSISLYLTDELYGFDGILGIILFACQLYVDFLAYSNFAIAFGLICGISLPTNFLAPYKSKSFSEFWRRWNITLSAWLKDYIYIPLGGNRKGQSRKVLNVYATFIVSAFWHGLTLPFFIWGLAHATLVAIESKLLVLRYTKWKQNTYQLFVLCAVVILWQLFRMEDLNGMVALVTRLSDFSVGVDMKLIVVTIIVIACVALIDSKWVNNAVFELPNDPKRIYGEVSLLSIMLMALLLCQYHPSFNFFYFRF